MITKEFSFLSADGRTRIHAVKWIPDSGQYKRILQITHGMIEYIERYIPFAEFLTSHECMVVGHDHIGHGQSVQSENDWGYFTKKNPSDTLIADMHMLRTMIQKENEGVPYFMLGHSMGSYMLRKYLAFHNDNLSGVLIMGTGYIPPVASGFGIGLVKTLACFRGWRYRSQFVAGGSFGKPYKKYDLSGETLHNSWLTKDQDIVKHYYSEPCCSFTFTINGYLGLFEAVLFDCQQKNVAKIPNSLPIFILSGADDPVGNNGAGVKKVFDMFKKTGNENITFKLYENDRHEILNETDRQTVYEDILNWIDLQR